jgi:hypothetical protein
MIKKIKKKSLPTSFKKQSTPQIPDLKQATKNSNMLKNSPKNVKFQPFFIQILTPRT